MNQSKQTTSKRNPIIVKRTMFTNKKNVPAPIVQEQEPKPSNQNEIINIRNQMIQQIANTHKNQTIIFKKEKPANKVRDQTVLIPISDTGAPIMNRALVTKYLVNAKGCTHTDVHLYASCSNLELEDKAIKYITMEQYGGDYPTVSQSKLIYCRKCIMEDDPLLIQSVARGSLKFVSSVSTRSGYAHAPVPDYVPMDRVVFQYNDDTWVNLSIADEHKYALNELKDHIITTVPRKNYIQVIALPPPFEATCRKFDDFGSVYFITSLENGFDHQDIFIEEDNDSEFELSDDEEQPITIRTVSKHNQIRSTTPVSLPQREVIVEDVEQTPRSVTLVPESRSPTPVPFLDNQPTCSIEPKQDDHVGLIMPMVTVDDFKNNVCYFHQMGYTVHIASCNDDISVNVVSPVDEKDKCIILYNLQTSGYNVDHIRDIGVCINNEIVTRWSFLITRKSNETKQITDKDSELQPISDMIDDYIADSLEVLSDECALPVITMLEKTYLLNEKDGINTDIFLNYTTPSESKGISKRDLNAYYKSGFFYAAENADRFLKETTYLLMYLRYCSIIPKDMIFPTPLGIHISKGK